MTLLKLHSEPLQEAWLDAYGHLNEAYYLVPFTNTTWKMQAHFGIGTDYFDETGCAFYTVETHLRYVNEVRAPAMLDVESMILDVTPKAARFAHVMKVGGAEAATFECLCLHYDTRNSRTAPFPETTLAMLEDAKVAELPSWAGRSIALKK